MYSNSVGGGSPGLAAGEIARIVLDAGAGAGGFEHLDIVAGALLQPLRLEQAAGLFQLGEAERSSSLIDLMAWFSVGRGVT
jgi:hypothetical protein